MLLFLHLRKKNNLIQIQYDDIIALYEEKTIEFTLEDVKKKCEECEKKIEEYENENKKIEEDIDNLNDNLKEINEQIYYSIKYVQRIRKCY